MRLRQNRPRCAHHPSPEAPPPYRRPLHPRKRRGRHHGPRGAAPRPGPGRGKFGLVWAVCHRSGNGAGPLGLGIWRLRASQRPHAGPRECRVRHSEWRGPAAHPAPVCPRAGPDQQSPQSLWEWLLPRGHEAAQHPARGRADLRHWPPPAPGPMRYGPAPCLGPVGCKEQNSRRRSLSFVVRQCPAARRRQWLHPWHCRHAAKCRWRFGRPAGAMWRTCRWWPSRPIGPGCENRALVSPRFPVLGSQVLGPALGIAICHYSETKPCVRRIWICACPKAGVGWAPRCER